jgi:glycosyltransferase involved in cell wall biosynthesis
MNPSLISVIVPCYNYGSLLAETLDSLVAQTYPNWECIIIDDGSTDNSRAVAEEYQSRDARFRYVYQPNKGMSAARNLGLTTIQGQFVQFLDADDLLAPRKFEKQIDYLATHSEIDLVYGDVRYFQHGEPAKYATTLNSLSHDWVTDAPKTKVELLNKLVANNIMVVNAPLTRTSLIQKVGFYNESLRSMEDWEYWLRCALAGAQMRYSTDPDMWAIVRVHSKSVSQNISRMAAATVQLRVQLAGWLQELGATAAERINEEAIVRCYVDTGQYELTQGSIMNGARNFVAVARHTGRYGYYLKSIPYWLMQRIRS